MPGLRAQAEGGAQVSPLKPLMGAKQIATELGISLREAENIFNKVARAHGGPIEILGEDGDPLVRRRFVERAWVEASIGQRAS